MVFNIKKYKKYLNQKNKLGLIVENYTFYKITCADNKYRCVNKNCGVYAKIIDEEYVQLSSEHNQIYDAKKFIKKREIMKEIKYKSENSFLKPKTIISDSCSSLDPNEIYFSTKK
ncbi:hypothetical protein DMUE_2240 [Dictyocoela muelleri]|nr:hypothetical protein DMUE_2240 [Dictyocoela muelleri]